MSKAAKMVVGAVVAIAAPYFAPAMFAAIAPSVAAAGGLGATAGAAGIGAAGSALGSYISGARGNGLWTSAALGALGGGLRGYQLGKAAAGAGNAPGAAAGAGAGAGAGAPAAGPTSITATAAGPTGIETGFNAGSPYLDASGGISSTANPDFVQSFNNVYGGGNPVTAGLAPQFAAAAPNIGGNLTYTPGAAATDTSYFGRLKDAGKDAWKQATDPKNLVSTGLRTGSHLLAAQMAGSGLTPEQEALMRQQRKDLEREQRVNAATDAVRADQSAAMLARVPQYDPNEMGLEYERFAKLRGARAAQAGMRGLQGPAAQAEKRRYALNTSRDTGSAYKKGWETGRDTQTNLIASGVGLLPSRYSPNYETLYNRYGEAAQDATGGADKLFGDIYGGLTQEDQGKKQHT